MPAKLPQFQSDDKDFQLLQNRWGAILNPVIGNPSNNTLILKNVTLLTGSNTINHLLGRKLQGWRISRQRSAASIYDTQDSNTMQDLTLILVTDADVSVDLEVF